MDDAELETEDLPRLETPLEREVRAGLARDQDYFDEHGRQLLTVADVVRTFRRLGRVYGPPPDAARRRDTVLDIDPEVTSPWDVDVE